MAKEKTVKKETLEEYLARGGKIEKVKAHKPAAAVAGKVKVKGGKGGAKVLAERAEVKMELALAG